MADSEKPNNNSSSNNHHEDGFDRAKTPDQTSDDEKSQQTNNMTSENQDTVTLKQIVDSHCYLAQRLRIWFDNRLIARIQSAADAMLAQEVMDGYEEAISLSIAADIHRPKRRRRHR